MEIRFRKAKEEDIQKIINLCNDCFSDGTNLDKAIDIFNKTKNDPNVIYLIGEYNKEIIAHTRINIIETIFKGMDTYAIVNHVCVNGKYRRNNIATQMLDEIINICKQKGCSSIKLWSMNFRVPAHTCYKKYGFKVTDASFFSFDIN